MLYKSVAHCLLLLLPCLVCAGRLNEYITHYEALDYEKEAIHRKHLRVKRSNDPHVQPPITMEFRSHRRNFSLRLKRSTSVFSKNLVIEGSDNVMKDVDVSHMYEGTLSGVPGSSVFGSLRDGVFDGKVYAPWGIFYIERAEKYFPYNSSFSQKYHSVIYSESDIRDPYQHVRTGHASGCGVTDEVEKWMIDIQNSAIPEESPSPKSNAHKLWLNHPPLDRSPSLKYSREAQSWHNETEEHKRVKRKVRDPPNKDKTTCTLFIETDPLFWKAINKEQNGDEQKTKDEITSLIGQHINAVNFIYKDTSFEGKYDHRFLQFEVQRIKIDTDRDCSDPKNKSKFCTTNLDVSNFLNLHSTDNHQDFCLAYVFTYRDFTGGTLGLAWVASAGGASGGICEKYKSYSENVHGTHKTTKRSLNTGIITFVNYNNRVPPKVSQLTLAHEIGHNFGSPHDWPSRCTPGGSDGNYIMFASATSGERPNNNMFSECSKKNISLVLDALREGSKENCFRASNGSFCGNKIVEEGEDCDCGYNEEECGDEMRCCFPRMINHATSSKSCKRRKSVRCSPSEGPCCTAQCDFRTDRQECHSGTNCTEKSYCDGFSAKCPPADHKANYTECNGNTQVCLAGECRGSICEKFNMEQCFLSSETIDDKKKLCELACQEYGQPETCKSTAEYRNIQLRSLRPGSPCDNYQGYCDVFLKCRLVDAEGPLLRLKNLLFNPDTFMNIADWVTRYWWGVLLMGIGLIIVMGAFLKFCAVHTPSSNPKQPPPRRLTDTLAAPVNTLRRMSDNSVDIREKVNLLVAENNSLRDVVDALQQRLIEVEEQENMGRKRNRNACIR